MVVLASRDEAAEGAELKRLLAERQISIMQATPVSWQMLLEAGWQPPAGFRALCGGEAMPSALCEALLARQVELWNMYGPTETCVWSSVERMVPGQERITIGKPIANTQFYIVDEQLEPCPVGVPGDLLIGGDGLAQGYLNRAELTAERFIANPFAEAGSRLYRTGDIARWLPDGRVECLGRSDFQVKIRGYRIELGEIEALLEQHEAVEQAVVTVKDFAPGDQRLVAYLIPANGESSAGELRDHLTQRLPDYMVPAAFVMLESYPQTPNGKIDRKALPLPDSGERSAAVPFVAPRNAVCSSSSSDAGQSRSTASRMRCSDPTPGLPPQLNTSRRAQPAPIIWS